LLSLTSWYRACTPPSKAKLKRRAQEIDARSKARLAAGRKKHAEFIADPKGYRTTPTQAANSTAELMIEHAERRAQKILEEAERRGVEIIQQARRGNPGRPTAAHPDPDEEPIRFRKDGDDGA
jgi:cell division septum initiation protein DivIVA